MEDKILLFGGSGRLGSSLQKIGRAKGLKIYAPKHSECDITQPYQVGAYFAKIQPLIVINSAALVGTKECEKNRNLAWRVNVDGATNIARMCTKTNKRCIFISSAAIFDGEKGEYDEEEPPSPTFYYAVTKVAAEQAVRMTPNHAIIRLDFFPNEHLKYQTVYIDHYTSKIPVGEAAAKIFAISLSLFQGTINIGRERESLYHILKPYYPIIKPIKIADSSLPDFPRDISLNLTQWKKLFDTDSKQSQLESNGNSEGPFC